MASKYDIEQCLLDVKAVLVSYLNTKLAAITTEKNDTITLKTIDSSAYFIHSMDGPQVNYDPFIYIGLQAIEGDGQMGASPSQLSIAVAAVVADEGQDVELWKRMFRYQRAIREVFEEHFEEQAGTFKFVVKDQVPIEISLLNDSYSHKAIGVTLSVALG